MNLFNFILIIAAFAMLISPSAAEVKTLTYCDTLPVKSTGWADNHTLPLFDPTLGDLVGVDLVIRLDVLQDFRFENKGTLGQTVAVESDVDLLITTPNSSSISVTASSSISENLAGFDGVVDYSGASGRSLEGVTSNSSKTLEYPYLSDFIASAPGENVSLPASTSVRSSSLAPGNCIFEMATFTGSKLCVTYTYEPEYPRDVGESR